MRLNKENFKIYNNYKNFEPEEKWLHIGSGNFHRAHQAFYMSKLIKKKICNWRIINYEIKNTEKNIKFNKEIRNQDNLYTLLTKAKKRENLTIINSINKFFLNKKKNFEYIEKKIHDGTLSLITITITENGYFIDDGNFNLKNKYLSSDIKNNNYKFQTIYGMLFLILKNCIKANKKITVISCDNIENNSESLKDCFKIFCNKKDKNVVKKINKHLIFCNSMVDRITPRYNKQTKIEIKKKYKLDDNCHVESEEYISWIIEKKKNSSLPPLRKVGVKFVKKISHFQEMKMQILNASHCSTSFLASLDKKKFVYQTFNDKKFILFLKVFMKKDVIPNLKKNFYNYNIFLKNVIDRFSNNAVPDLVSRTTVNGSKNIEIFICKCFKKNFINKKNLKRYALIFASWYIFIIKSKFEDDNKKYLKQKTKFYKKPEQFIKNNRKPNLRNMINKEFIIKFNLYINLLKLNKIKSAINDSIK